MGVTPPRQAATGLRIGIIWNVAALAFLAVAGITLNLLIGRLYSAADLGLFNIIFALFILVSQLTTFGLHHATLRAASLARDEPKRVGRAVVSALSGMLLINILVLPLAAAAAPVMTRFFEGAEGVSSAWLLVVPGLLFFAANKILLAAINGMRDMRAFAMFQAARFIFIFAALGGLVLLDADGAELPACLSLAEVALCPLLLIHLRRRGVFREAAIFDLDQLKQRLRFGAKVFPAGTLSELNTRVDVLMLGLFLDARQVGVYTVALLAFDAATQFIFVLRNNINPLIASAVDDGRSTALLAISRKAALGLFALFTSVALGIWFVFPAVIGIILPDPVYQAAREPMVILLAGLALVGGGMTFNQALAQAGFPGWQSLYVGSAVGVNVVANALLIPSYGIAGAAAGTILALLVSSIAIVVLLRRRAGLRIIA
ncbi:MAG: oligosaccharide flippase family protein [Alphaproteobacteria bacterium]